MFHLVSYDRQTGKIALRGRHSDIGSVIVNRLAHSSQGPRLWPRVPYVIHVDFYFDPDPPRQPPDWLEIVSVEVSFDERPGKKVCFYRRLELEGEVNLTVRGGLKNFYLEENAPIMDDIQAFILHLEEKLQEREAFMRLVRQGPKSIPEEDALGDEEIISPDSIPLEEDLAAENLENTAHD